MSYTPEGYNRIELPVAAYEAFLDLRNRVLAYEIDPETAQAECIEILRPYWTHQPQPWEKTEIVLKPTVSNIVLAK